MSKGNSWGTRLLLAGWLMSLFASASEAGSSENDQHYAAWRETYYGANVIEYCGIASDAVKEGFRIKIRYLRSWSPMPAAIEKEIRRWAMARAEYEYLDHSLGGHRIWCETDGLGAVRSFLSFRERDRAVEGEEAP
jgi:hypothetical protein